MVIQVLVKEFPTVVIDTMDKLKNFCNTVDCDEWDNKEYFLCISTDTTGIACESEDSKFITWL